MGVESRAEVLAALEAERFGPPVPDFGPVDGPQRQAMLDERRQEAEALGALEFLEQERERAQKEYDRRVRRKQDGRRVSA